MKKTKLTFSLVALIFSLLLQAQRQEIKGKLIADDDVEGIHIINKTASKYTVSNEKGEFSIEAKATDTLFISSLIYNNKEIIISKEHEDSNSIEIKLDEKVSELDKVIVGKILTGSLQSDLENSNAKTEINFYDLGIPGNTKLPLTQNEKKLHDADGGSWGHLGLGFGVNFHKLLNKISGRTKKLKDIVELDDRDKCINRLRIDYESIIFENDTLPKNLRDEYFLFSQEDENFLNLCKKDNDIELLEFLQQKLKAYRENLDSSNND
ncbi:carboxypeptidase-like regulatory domain-containing protein [Winogradskyella marincola]|uniref:Carboxypeptidase-like regulatory domain-containing protein n=1 Tax=Winogradskyella marincola TaxID=3037795 RepID=A0ABT6FY30_9FLAO|nr:carboxypeptidase-like regulatory domain-containing protein [Winogradskyella sp. YYF002]MDG4714693.1 carboxypeptidase-like regulatory domain-containing protein [Winogradskyella sp. YYF002]